MTSRVEVGDRHGLERQRARRAVGDRRCRADGRGSRSRSGSRDRRGGSGSVRQPAGRDVERHVPPVVDERRVGHADLADDLGPQLERVARRLPARHRDLGPSTRTRDVVHLPQAIPAEMVDLASAPWVQRPIGRRCGWRSSSPRLSLGIDLGFGQPMEHVLRQCLIATRLAERVGLDDDERAGVYYTSLLINVGCHTDAYEQAKWFGDDIDLKATKFEYEHGKSFRELVAMVRRIGAGQPPAAADADRRRVRAARPPRRERHDHPARRAGEDAGHRARAARLACARPSACAYEQWDGKGWPGTLAGDDDPHRGPARRAGRVHRGGPPGAGCRRGAGRWPSAGRARSSIPRWSTCLEADADDIFGGLDEIGTWTAVIDAEPALTVQLSDERVRLGAAGHRQLRRPQVAVHARPLPRRRRAVGRGRRPSSGSTRPRSARCGEPAWCTGSVGSACRTRIWDKPGPLAAGEWERVRMQPYLTGRMLQQSDALAPLGALGRASTASGSTARAIPEGLSGLAHLAPGACPRCRRRLPVDARAPPVPAGADRPTRRRPSCSARSRPDGSTATP